MLYSIPHDKFIIKESAAMPIKNLKYASLYDIYGGLLSEKQKYAVEMYYCDDLSLSEIAEHMGITRQGVRDQIKHAEQELDRFESCLGLFRKNENLREILEKIRNGLENDKGTAMAVTLCESALEILDN